MKKILNKIQELLNKYSTGRNVLVLFVVTQAIYFFMLLCTIPNVMSYAHGMKILDMQPLGYSVQYAKDLFYNLGEAGRAAYLFKQIPVDMFYPAFFAIANSLLLTYLFKKSFSPKSKLQKLNLIPILGGLFDYLENIGFIIMLSMYPTFSPALVRVANVFSILKSIFVMSFFVLLTIGIIGFCVQKFKKEKN